MNFEFTEKLSELRKKINNIRKCINIDDLRIKLSELEAESQDQNLWDNPQKAQNLMREKSKILSKVNNFDNLLKRFKDLEESEEIIKNCNDGDMIAMANEDMTKIDKLINEAETDLLFSEEFDNNDAFLTINSGAGGTESNDWTSMLLRMYTRWCDNKKFKIHIIDRLAGEDAGIKSVTIKVEGQKAFGWLKNESGVHRLVRISPFDSNGKRHTSFSSVSVYPIIEGEIDIQIDEKDLKIDTYRSSGAGGQHVNKTDSAIRITHLPTGLVVQSQSGRSQHQNKDEAMERLKMILYQRESDAKKHKIESGHEKKSIEWGHQIRSYTLEPYQMVTDLRTEYKENNALAVLDGDLDEFMKRKMVLDKTEEKS